MKLRDVVQTVKAVPASDGAGVQLKRVMGRLNHQTMDPFLMLDEIHSTDGDGLAGGFPSHPHRGMETISIMLKGGFQHEDHMGNVEEIGSGGVQWMRAGRGVIHSEMPIAENRQLHGFQLWLNLPGTEKMSDPDYLGLSPEEIPMVRLPNASCRLIAGKLLVNGEEHRGAVERAATRPLIVDVRLSEDSTTHFPVDCEKAMFYVYSGSVSVSGSTSIGAGHLVVLGSGDTLALKNHSEAGLLLLGGTPLNEPVVQYGPFVMNTEQEVRQAMEDYKNGVLVS